MPTTFEETLDWFILYGNVHGQTRDELSRALAVATVTQLRNAVWYAMRVSNRPREEVEKVLAILLIVVE